MQDVWDNRKKKKEMHIGMSNWMTRYWNLNTTCTDVLVGGCRYSMEQSKCVQVCLDTPIIIRINESENWIGSVNSFVCTCEGWMHMVVL